LVCKLTSAQAQTGMSDRVSQYRGGIGVSLRNALENDIRYGIDKLKTRLSV